MGNEGAASKTALDCSTATASAVPTGLAVNGHQDEQDLGWG